MFVVVSNWYIESGEKGTEIELFSERKNAIKYAEKIRKEYEESYNTKKRKDILCEVNINADDMYKNYIHFDNEEYYNILVIKKEVDFEVKYL